MMTDKTVRLPAWLAATATILVAIDLAAWLLRRMVSNFARNPIAPGTVVLTTCVVIAATAWCIARSAPRFAVLAAAMVSAGAVLISRLILILLAYFLPGLIQRDHAAWVTGSIVEGFIVALVCGSLAALVAGLARLSARRVLPVD